MSRATRTQLVPSSHRQSQYCRSEAEQSSTLFGTQQRRLQLGLQGAAPR